MAKDIQWKYQNNKVVTHGFIRAELKQEDCLIEGNVFYIANLPQGVIVKGLSVLATDIEQPDFDTLGSLHVDLGVNDCKLCEYEIDFRFGRDKESTNLVCSTNCVCVLTDKDYPIRVTLKKDFPIGNLMFLLEVIDPNHLSDCAIDPYQICTITKMVEPCTPNSPCDCADIGCGEDTDVTDGTEEGV